MASYKPMSNPVNKSVKSLTDSRSVFKHLQEFMKDFETDKEYVILIGLNSRYNLIYCNIEAMGGMDKVAVDQIILFKRLIVNNCKNFIIAHNHPSNDTSPSPEDVAFTENIKKSGDLLGLKLIDHIVFASDFSGYQTLIS